ncbi:MAG: DEAD/DEAH box helicase family protein [Pirellulales bacterium]
MLRPYQEQAVAAVYRHLRERDDSPVVVCPTGSGKTWIIARIAADATSVWDGRVLILAHRKELLAQNADKLRRLDPQLQVGIYSAGLKRRDQKEAVIVAGIQSIWRRACDFEPFDLVLVDECHLLSPEDEGMYRKFLSDLKVVNPRLRVIGLTATPFRLKDGPICTPDGFLNHICHEVGVRELIVEGFLSPLVTKAGRVKADMSRLHVRGGEFVASEVEDLMDDDSLVVSACDEIVEQTHDRQAVLIFASGVRHGEHIVRVLAERHSIECGFVTGATPSRERDQTLARFQAGELRFMTNIDVLSTGFDAPHIDCVALLRPTQSAGLYYQQVGRGFRLHPGKKNCLVLDFGGNVLRHGPVDQLSITTRSGGQGSAPAKECPQCQAVIAAGFATCPECGFEFPPPDRQKHEAQASAAGILSGQVTDTEYEVHDVYYRVHSKRGAADDAPRSMRVDYRIGLNRWQSEYVCFEHQGYARLKAEEWWAKRSADPIPDTAERAVDIACGGGVAPTYQITVRAIAGEKYDRIVDHQLGEIPEPVGPCGAIEDDDIPF